MNDSPMLEHIGVSPIAMYLVSQDMLRLFTSNSCTMMSRPSNPKPWTLNLADTNQEVSIRHTKKSPKNHPKP